MRSIFLYLITLINEGARAPIQDLASQTFIDVCKLPMSVGHCRGYDERWFFDWNTGVCEPFGYSGCGGNANNFRNREHCQYACGNAKKSTDSKTTVAPIETSTKKLKPTPPSTDNEVMQNDTPLSQAANTSDCEMGPWLGWGNCFGDCNHAVKLNYRLVLKTVSNSDKTCQKLVKTRACKPQYCRNLVLTTNSPDMDNKSGSVDD